LKKIAIFVEGQTEQLFVEAFLKEIASTKNIAFAKRRLVGKARSVPNWINIWTSANSAGNEFFILIVDCTGYTTVISDIRENYDLLVRAGYSAILGIRDVYPQVGYSDIAKLRAMLPYGLRTVPIQVELVLGVMEIETWFISEYTHFSRIDPSLTCARIKASIGFDPATDDIQQRAVPSRDLDDIYSLVGQGYQKNHNSLQALLSKLDFAILYCEIRSRLPDLNRFINTIDTFFET